MYNRIPTSELYFCINMMAISAITTCLDKGQSHHPRDSEERAFLSSHALTYFPKATTLSMRFLLVYGQRMELNIYLLLQADRLALETTSAPVACVFRVGFHPARLGAGKKEEDSSLGHLASHGGHSEPTHRLFVDCWFAFFQWAFFLWEMGTSSLAVQCSVAIAYSVEFRIARETHTSGHMCEGIDREALTVEGRPPHPPRMWAAASLCWGPRLVASGAPDFISASRMRTHMTNGLTFLILRWTVISNHEPNSPLPQLFFLGILSQEFVKSWMLPSLLCRREQL